MGRKNDMGTTEERLWQKVIKADHEDDCWGWRGSLRRGVVPVIAINRREKTARRVTWELTFGEVPTGMEVRRTCSSAQCCNPRHLRIAHAIGSDETERFWAAVDKRGANDCWEWQAALDNNGYGQIHFRGKKDRAHRVSWMVTNGPIPDEMTVDHLCFYPRCVNPNHLRLLTLSENSANQLSALATHCVRGHPRTPENLLYKPAPPPGKNRNGRASCIPCVAARKLEKRTGKRVVFWDDDRGDE